MSVKPLILSGNIAGPPSPVVEDLEYSTTYIADRNGDITETDNSGHIKNTTMLHDVSELTWLNVSNSAQLSITLKETNTTYQVLMNTVSKKNSNKQ